MSNEIIISNTNDDNLKPVATKEEFINYVATYHGEKNSKMQTLIDKDDWTIMQRLFTGKELIKVAKDQRITQVKNSFDLINQAESILNGLIIASLKNRAKALELKDMFHHEIEAIKDIHSDVLNLDIEMRGSEYKFSQFYVSEKKKIEEFRDDIDLYQENLDSIVEMRKKYFATGKTQLEKLHTKISAIETKYK